MSVPAYAPGLLLHASRGADHAWARDLDTCAEQHTVEEARHFAAVNRTSVWGTVSRRAAPAFANPLERLAADAGDLDGKPLRIAEEYQHLDPEIGRHLTKLKVPRPFPSFWIHWAPWRQVTKPYPEPIRRSRRMQSQHCPLIMLRNSSHVPLG